MLGTLGPSKVLQYCRDALPTGTLYIGQMYGAACLQVAKPWPDTQTMSHAVSASTAIGICGCEAELRIQQQRQCSTTAEESHVHQELVLRTTSRETQVSAASARSCNIRTVAALPGLQIKGLAGLPAHQHNRDVHVAVTSLFFCPRCSTSVIAYSKGSTACLLLATSSNAYTLCAGRKTLTQQ